MKLVLLTNFIPPYQIPFYSAIDKRVDELTILLSTQMENGRLWPVEWSSLKVKVQKTITLPRRWKHPHGFTELLYTHFPLDTIWILMQLKPDWIISCEFGARTLQSVIYHKMHPQTKLAIWATISEYSEMGRGWVRESLRKWIIPKADLIMVNGKSGERYIKRLNPSAGKIIYIPYTTDLHPFLNININRSQTTTRRLLYSGQLIPRKGLLEFHKVFCMWAENHPEKIWEWWCIGDGPLRDKLSVLPIPQNAVIKLHGNIQYSELAKYYQLAGAFIFPTLADEWGVVINEAMGSGLPILGSVYSQAVEELIEEGVTGWLFRPDHPDEIYTALNKFYTIDEQELNNMRIAVRRKISNITSEVNAKKLVMSLENHTHQK